MGAEVQVAESFTNLFSVLRASIVQQAFAMWFGMSSYRDPDISDWLELALPLVQAGQETSSTATTAYIQMQMDVLGNDGIITPPEINLVTGSAIRNGVPPEVVYARPFVDVWTALSNGKDFAEAIQMGADRLRRLIETDLQLSHTHTARNIFSRQNKVQGFKRVPTGSYTCALCMVASTQTYRKFDLLPIHPGCDCRVAPVISEDTIPRVDKETLERIHSAIQKQFGLSARDAREVDYRKITLVEEHGEYGPTLTIAGHKFTGPDGLKGKEAPSWSTDFSDFNNALALG